MYDLCMFAVHILYVAISMQTSGAQRTSKNSGATGGRVQILKRSTFYVNVFLPYCPTSYPQRGIFNHQCGPVRLG